MPELWNVMIHPSGRGSVGGRPRPGMWRNTNMTARTHYNTNLISDAHNYTTSSQDTYVWGVGLATINFRLRIT